MSALGRPAAFISMEEGIPNRRQSAYLRQLLEQGPEREQYDAPEQ
jgi:hypothetical protein